MQDYNIWKKKKKLSPYHIFAHYVNLLYSPSFILALSLRFNILKILKLGSCA